MSDRDDLALRAHYDMLAHPNRRQAASTYCLRSASDTIVPDAVGPRRPSRPVAAWHFERSAHLKPQACAQLWSGAFEGGRGAPGRPKFSANDEIGPWRAATPPPRAQFLMTVQQLTGDPRLTRLRRDDARREREGRSREIAALKGRWTELHRDEARALTRARTAHPRPRSRPG